MISKEKIISDFENGLISLDDIVDFVRADAIDEYKKQLLEYLIPLKDKYFDLVKGTEMPERYTHLKRMDTVNIIIEMVKIKAEQLKGAE